MLPLQVRADPRSNSNEGVLSILQISKAAALPSDGLVSYQDNCWGGAGGSNPSAEIQLVYSTVPTKGESFILKKNIFPFCFIFAKVSSEKKRKAFWFILRGLSKDNLIRDILLWTTTYGHTSTGWTAKSYIFLLYADIRCRLEDLPRVMTKRDRWWERVKGIHAVSIPWWCLYLITIPIL